MWPLPVQDGHATSDTPRRRNQASPQIPGQLVDCDFMIATCLNCQFSCRDLTPVWLCVCPVSRLGCVFLSLPLYISVSDILKWWMNYIDTFSEGRVDIFSVFISRFVLSTRCRFWVAQFVLSAGFFNNFRMDFRVERAAIIIFIFFHIVCFVYYIFVHVLPSWWMNFIVIGNSRKLSKKTVGCVCLWYFTAEEYWTLVLCSSLPKQI